MKYDLVVKKGTLIDPAQGIHAPKDIAFSDGRVLKVTSIPADTIFMPKQVGTLAEGAWGDAVIFEMREGEFQLVDARGKVKICRQKLEPIVVIKGGNIYRQRRMPN